MFIEASNAPVQKNLLEKIVSNTVYWPDNCDVHGLSRAGSPPATSRLLQMPVEPGIEPTLCNQLLVIALFGNAPTIKHQHPVSLFYRR